ncbi:GH3 auxin-responsive promoter family protein [Chloroflexota bacterium]
MTELSELVRQGKNEELWQRCCGFIDLSLEDFMKIQKRLLMEQVDLQEKCELGRFIMNGTSPRSVSEFRRQVPLTTYADYAPYLLKRRMDVLPKKPILWQYTSGKYGEYSHRWAPVTTRQLEEIEPLILALVLFSSCKKRGEVNFRQHDKVLYGMAPPPYTTGTMARTLPQELFDFLPPLDDAEIMPFEERIRQGFEMALHERMDLCLTLSSVAVAIGNRFSQKGRGTSLKSLPKKPKTLLRLAKGIVKSKLARRQLLPRDIWSLKGLITYGIDGSVYRENIKEMWGRYPLDFHGCTEAVMIAMQTWDYQGMTFIPHLNFFEFIPEEEAIKSREDPTYQPSTLLLDELQPGNYELVITSLHGGPFIRYRLGHLIKITSLRNEQLDIDIPQMVFLSRIDDQIDIAGFTRLSEKVVWQAIENTGIAYKDWVACKEVRDKPILHLYVEPKEEVEIANEQLASAIHKELKKLDSPYAELESFTGLRPLEVTLLPKGAFQAYKSRQQAAGADLTHLKPPHFNPPDATVNFLKQPTRQVAAGEIIREKVEA